MPTLQTMTKMVLQLQALELGVDSGRFSYVDSCDSVSIFMSLSLSFPIPSHLVRAVKYGRRAGRGKGKIHLQPLGFYLIVISYSILSYTNLVYSIITLLLLSLAALATFYFLFIILYHIDYIIQTES